jgi:two-component system response regulator RegX3
VHVYASHCPKTKGEKMSKKIMVVDDNRDVRYSIGEALSQKGFAVTEAAGADDCLALMDKNDYDIFLVDIMMPDKDGWQLCHEIRQKTDVPIIIISADQRELAKRMAQKVYKAEYYIEKPFDEKDLIKKIQEALGEKK